MSDKLNNGSGSPRRSTRTPKPENPAAAPPSRRSGSGRVSDRLASGARADTPQHQREKAPLPAQAGTWRSRKPSTTTNSSMKSPTKQPSQEKNSPQAKNGTATNGGFKPKGGLQQLGNLAGMKKDKPKTDAPLERVALPKNKESKGKSGAENNDGGKKSAANAAADGAKGKAKASARGANATGVDYSDKSLKDQLEHQAADIAMDATPVLGQINSARKVLKDANKKKREATGQTNDDVLDKVEKGADKVVDGGIKGVKVAAGSVLAGSTGAMAMTTMIALKLLMMLKGAAVAMAGKIFGFFAGILKSAGSFVSSLLGVTASVGNAIAAGGMAVVMGVTGTLGIGVIDSFNKDPGNLACLPETTKVPEASQEYVEGGGDASLIQEENAGKLWSVYSTIGASKEQTAAVLGNLQHESNLDPTATETIFDEPFQMGPRKMAALAADYNVGKIDAAYAARFPAIKHVGIGLAQWTNDRNRLLIKYAKDKGANWYEFDTQIGFMLAGDSPARQTQLKDFLASAPGNIDTETERFMNTWIGLSSPNPSYSDRVSNATNYLFILERATADTAYADGILSGINVNRGEGNAAAGAYQKDDGCGNAIATHYRGDKVEDGTGEVPSGLALVPWSRDTLPESLKEFAVDPSLAGLEWGNATGWAPGIIADQCVALATSYFMQLYPDWNKDGRAGTRPFGNGKDTAPGWAKHYGEQTTATPTAGAVFSDKTTSVYGHTGIVQHVFANGDIMIAEQNIRGVSGGGAGISYSWSWRVIKKDKYQQNNWVFFKPSDAEPQWEKGSPV